MSPGQVDGFVDALGADFLVDALALEAALVAQHGWNIIHLPTVTKIDLLLRGASEYDHSEFERRERVEVRAGQWLFVKRPEDSVLRKLLWFREGGGVSDRQWRDVLGVLRHSSGLMSFDYLEHWAQEIGVKDLLDRARQELDAS